MPIDEDNFDEFMQRIRGASAVALNEAAVEAERFARTHMVRLSSRKTYFKVLENGKKTRAKRKQTDVFTSSPPGGFPGVRTSNLRNSMTTSTADAENLVSSFGVYGGGKYQAGARAAGPHTGVRGTGTKGYALALQTGTARVRARPWATLTLAQAPIAKRFESSIRREMTKGK